MVPINPNFFPNRSNWSEQAAERSVERAAEDRAVHLGAAPHSSKAGTSASGTGEEASRDRASRGGTSGVRRGRKAIAQRSLGRKATVQRGPRPTISSTSTSVGSDDDVVDEVVSRPRTRMSSRGEVPTPREGSVSEHWRRRGVGCGTCYFRHRITPASWQIMVTPLFLPSPLTFFPLICLLHSYFCGKLCAIFVWQILYSFI